MTKIETNLTAAQVAIAEALFAREYTVTIGKREGTPTSTVVPVTDMPEAAWVKMFAYGVQRTFNDAVGGSDTSVADKVKAVKAMIDNFKKGIVGRVSTGTDALTNAMRAVARAALWAKCIEDLGKAKAKEWFDAFEKKSDAEQLAVIDNIIEANRAKIEAKAKADMEEAARRRAEKAALNASIKIDL